MLQLKPRIDFGGIPFDPPVEFSLAWLQSTFVPAQRARRSRIVEAITAGEARIESIRKAAVSKGPEFGTRSGKLLHKTVDDQRAERDFTMYRDRQILQEQNAVRREVDGVVYPILTDMDRAVSTAKVLRERVFDKLSCLSRVSADMKLSDLIAFKANCTSLVRGAEPIVLYRMAQAAIDSGKPSDLIMIEAILSENIKLSTKLRQFTNQELLKIVTLPEFNEAVGTEKAPGLLMEVLTLREEAGARHAGFNGKNGEASVARITSGLRTLKLDSTGIPPEGDE